MSERRCQGCGADCRRIAADWWGEVAAKAQRGAKAGQHRRAESVRRAASQTGNGGRLVHIGELLDPEVWGVSEPSGAAVTRGEA